MGSVDVALLALTRWLSSAAHGIFRPGNNGLAGRFLPTAPPGKSSASCGASSDHLVLVCLGLPCFSRGTPTSSHVPGKPGQLATPILDHAAQTPGKGTALPQPEMPYTLLPYMLMGNQHPEPRKAFPLIPKSCPRGDPRQSCIVNELN